MMRKTYPMTKLPAPVGIVVMNGVWYQRENLLSTREWLVSQLAGNKRTAWERKFMKNRIEEIDAALNKTRKSNPAKKRAVRRKGVTRSKYVTRPSQMTKKPPTKRLKKRRAKAVAAPKKGYFPNPGKVRVIRENPAPLVYYVHPLVERTSAQYMHGGSIARAPFDHDDVEQWKIASSRVAPKRQNLFVIPTERMDMKAFRAWYSENHKKLIMGSLNDIKRALRPFLLKK